MIFKEKYIKTKCGLSIFTESIGDQKNPTIVLIMGAMNQGLFWYDEFCKAFSDKGFFVIRYDHRDVGFSSVVDYRNNPYNLNDMTDDVIEILAGYKVAKANIVGISMGGYIGQILAAKYPKIVGTLTLISTTADHRPYMEATSGNLKNIYDLPFPRKIFLDYIQKNNLNPPKNEDDFKDFQIEGWRIMLGSKTVKKDMDEIIRLIELSNKRNKNKFSVFNHGLSVANSENRLELVKSIKVPTLIIHGTDDACFPLEHAVLLNKSIKGSKMEIIDGMGHMFAFSETGSILSKVFGLVKNVEI